MAVNKEISLTSKSLKEPLPADSGFIILYGTEELLIENFLSKLKQQFGYYNLYHGEELDPENFITLLGEKSLFSPKGKTVNVVKHAERFFSKFRTKRQKERLLRLLERPISNLVVFIIPTDLKRSDWNKEPYRTLAKVAAAVYAAKKLTRPQIEQLVKKKFQKAGIKVPQEVINYLLESFSDLMQLRTEVEKLITYAAGKGELTLQEVKQLVEGHPEYTVFDLQREFFNRNLQGAIKIFRRLSAGLNPYEQTPLVLQIQGLLLSTANRMLIALERTRKGENLKSFAREIGLYYPFQVTQFKNWLHFWEEKELVNLIRKLYQLDTDIKLRFVPAGNAFESFLVETLG